MDHEPSNVRAIRVVGGLVIQIFGKHLTLIFQYIDPTNSGLKSICSCSQLGSFWASFFALSESFVSEIGTVVAHVHFRVIRMDTQSPCWGLRLVSGALIATCETITFL